MLYVDSRMSGVDKGKAPMVEADDKGKAPVEAPEDAELKEKSTFEVGSSSVPLRRRPRMRVLPPGAIYGFLTQHLPIRAGPIREAIRDFPPGCGHNQGRPAPIHQAEEMEVDSDDESEDEDVPEEEFDADDEFVTDSDDSDEDSDDGDGADVDDPGEVIDPEPVPATPPVVLGPARDFIIEEEVHGGDMAEVVINECPMQ